MQQIPVKKIRKSKGFTFNGRLPTLKQKAFIRRRFELANGTKAAREVYNVKNDNVAANIASENLRKPNVIQLIESFANSAAIRVKQLSDQNKNLSVALTASRDILDRSGYKPIEKSASLSQIEIKWKQ